MHDSNVLSQLYRVLNHDNTRTFVFCPSIDNFLLFFNNSPTLKARARNKDNIRHQFFIKSWCHIGLKDARTLLWASFFSMRTFLRRDTNCGGITLNFQAPFDTINQKSPKAWTPLTDLSIFKHSSDIGWMV